MQHRPTVFNDIQCKVRPLDKGVAKKMQDVPPYDSVPTEARHKGFTPLGVEANLPKGGVQRDRDLVVAMVGNMTEAAPLKHRL